jgi:hypothetical protein
MLLESIPPIANVALRRFAVLFYVRLAERNLPMKWLIACVITIGFIGCKGSQTSVNTLAPFGSSRVPPPSTNYFNASGPYYNRAAPPQTATPAMPGAVSAPAAAQAPGATSGQIVPNASASSTGGAWLPPARMAVSGMTNAAAVSPEASSVQAAAYQGAAEPLKHASSSAADVSSLRLAGMPVNDATNSSAGPEPARFVPTGAPIEIGQLPPAAPALAGVPASATVMASAQASDQPAQVSSPSQSTLNWKSRP